jgi:hypothetical protein
MEPLWYIQIAAFTAVKTSALLSLSEIRVAAAVHLTTEMTTDGHIALSVDALNQRMSHVPVGMK